MEIALMSKNYVRIKGKQSTLLVYPPISTPEKLTKSTEAEVLLFLDHIGPSGKNSQLIDTIETNKIQGMRVEIKGPGDYEISGSKISSYRLKHNLVHFLMIDGIYLFIGGTEGVELFDKKRECQIALFCANSLPDSTFVTGLAPRLLIFYSDKAQEAAKEFGGTISSLSKITTSLDKLPDEMEVFVLASS